MLRLGDGGLSEPGIRLIIERWFARRKQDELTEVISSRCSSVELSSGNEHAVNIPNEQPSAGRHYAAVPESETMRRQTIWNSPSKAERRLAEWHCGA